ncbi:MAG: tripartite tricarboxylate transporter TctB family protein [Burkholderiaceae bacterium]
MSNRNVVRGLFLMGIALLFGLWSFKYNMGQLSRSGPGLFPFMVSCILFTTGVITLVRARFIEPVALGYNIKNISLILASLVGFTLLSMYVNMIAGIVFMVFCASFAGTSYSNVRNVKVAIGLTLVAFGFKYLLGLNLPLI